MFVSNREHIRKKKPQVCTEKLGSKAIREVKNDTRK